MPVDAESTRVRELDYERGFRPPRMVRWFHPIEITRTAITAVLAKVITGYADPRESQHGDAVVPDRAGQKGASFIDLSEVDGERIRKRRLLPP